VTPTAASPGERYLGLKSHLRLAVVPGEAAYLLSPLGVTALEGGHVEVIAPLLDGSRTLAGIVRDAAPAASAADVGHLVGRLTEAGLIAFREKRAAAEAEQDRAAEAFWDLAGLNGSLAADSLARTPIALTAVGGVDLAAAREACLASGLRIVEADDTDAETFSLVLCDDYLNPELAAVDADRRRAGRPWLLVKPGGPEPWTGPVFQPGAGPCWHCLAVRLAGHRRHELPAQRGGGSDRPLPPEASIAAARTVALQVAVLETAKWLVGVRQPEQGAVYTLDTLTLRGRHHQVARRPQCPECGDPGIVAARTCKPVTPCSRPKAAGGGSNHRALSAEQMLEQHKGLIDPVTGIVKQIVEDPAAPDFIRCAASGPNAALQADTLVRLRAGLRSQSGGKGLTAVEARVGALCEAVERYSAVRQGDECTVLDSYRGLGEHAAVHPDACQLFDARQFADRATWNALNSPFQRVCEPFDDCAPIEWTPAWSLTGQRFRLLPTALLYFDAHRTPGPRQVLADSNGSAAGSSLEDALVQGFLELVERDAVALWWYNRTRQPAVDLDAFDEPWLAALRDGYRRLGREVWALDLTSDLGIPAMAVLSRRADLPGGRVIFGFAAHHDPRLALRRAMTEMGQLFAAHVGGEAAADRPADPDLESWWDAGRRLDLGYLEPDPGQAPRTPASYDYTPNTDLLDDVTAITALTRRHGLDLLVLDQTRPDLGIPVVKAVVPGLRHFWARFAPGRLFDAPARLGRVPRPTRYEDLNPIPMFV
jgi:ribosomal protein S12 methylthiotransferase accessory factor